MKAQALWITAPEVMEIREEELPAPKYDELQIQTKAVGICAWDSYLYRGMSAPGPCPTGWAMKAWAWSPPWARASKGSRWGTRSS